MNPVPERLQSLLKEVVAADQDLWTRGSHDALERRRTAITAATAAGCSLAEVLHVLPEDIDLWSQVRMLPALRL